MLSRELARERPNDASEPCVGRIGGVRAVLVARRFAVLVGLLGHGREGARARHRHQASSHQDRPMDRLGTWRAMAASGRTFRTLAMTSPSQLPPPAHLHPLERPLRYPLLLAEPSLPPVERQTAGDVPTLGARRFRAGWFAAPSSASEWFEPEIIYICLGGWPPSATVVLCATSSASDSRTASMRRRPTSRPRQRPVASYGTPSPLAYMTPRLNWASARPLLGKRQ